MTLEPRPGALYYDLAFNKSRISVSNTSSAEGTGGALGRAKA